MKVVLVSAADATFWPYLSGMLASIEAGVKRDGIEVGILDLGLSTVELARLERFGAVVVRPAWDYDLTHFSIPAKETFKAMTARPHLPRYFPGYDVYVWIDADAWVQDWGAIPVLITGASEGQFAAVAESHDAYKKRDDWIKTAPNTWVIYYQYVRKSLGTDVASQIMKHATLNSGVFAAQADAPHWSCWDACLNGALKRLDRPFKFVEQLALNVVAYHERLEVHWLPSKYNWVCHKALPMLSPTKGKLIDPSPPHDELGIIHLVGRSKRQSEFDIRDADGRIHSCTLRHPCLGE
jgi:lipopolysaccharide biosynthesis glycosyltransferase